MLMPMDQLLPIINIFHKFSSHLLRDMHQTNNCKRVLTILLWLLLQEIHQNKIVKYHLLSNSFNIEVIKSDRRHLNIREKSDSKHPSNATASGKLQTGRNLPSIPVLRFPHQ